MSEFLQMGGYGAYVWSAFGFAALVLLGLLIQSWRSARRRETELDQVRALVRPTAIRRPTVQAPRRATAPRVMAGTGPSGRAGER